MTRIGRYQLLGLLGRGGMGEVWRAHDSSTDRVVALKLLLPQLTHDGEFQRRFRHEAQAAAALTEPHIVPIHSFGEIEGRLYVDMRLVEGRDLKSILDLGPLEPTLAVSVIEQVASALRAAHQVGLVHRDVKPSNILVAEDNFAYLIDFGIARSVDGTRVTSAGAVMGTWTYMAPERFEDADSDPRSDGYALACVLYECLTGVKPFPGSSLESQYSGHRSATPPCPSHFGLSTSFDGVIARGMAKEPGQRYQTVAELAGAARAACTGDVTGGRTSVADRGPDWSQPTRMAPRQARNRRPKMLGVVVTVTATVLVGSLIVMNVDTSEGSTPPASTATAPPAAEPEPAQTVLPFTGLVRPMSVAVDLAGNAYTVSRDPNRVLKLTVGATAPTELAVTDLVNGGGVAVDSVGDVYVSDITGNRVVKLSAKSNLQTVLPFTDLSAPTGVSVDAAGNVYVADWLNDRVLMLPVGSNVQTVLPLQGVERPSCVASDSAGNIYVTTTLNEAKVYVLRVGTSSPTVLPFVHLEKPRCVAVDFAGNVYVTERDAGKVLKLDAGTDTVTELPFSGLRHAWGVAVDGAGAVYVVDIESFRVLRLRVP
ncbi:hypothetical protein BVC93_22330 [Mycobacterium sp. MS1601]|uniref:serine/threonine-protein kinase PknD n=1 Tax=Mycobacterium sp. MS1601 TaxID=1936029 RepID=UPI0009791A7C|nr:serine/threonine-protein kinase PknD [Mycobacterium sp. MS1601]AQA04704.1 hypothetical protein BVC93_22330 [Mycobacterium sp. MS1601]